MTTQDIPPKYATDLREKTEALITERKQAEKALRESEERFYLAMGGGVDH